MEIQVHTAIKRACDFLKTDSYPRGQQIISFTHPDDIFAETLILFSIIESFVDHNHKTIQAEDCYR